MARPSEMLILDKTMPGKVFNQFDQPVQIEEQTKKMPS